jgi:hypothetical protein
VFADQVQLLQHGVEAQPGGVDVEQLPCVVAGGQRAIDDFLRAADGQGVAAMKSSSGTPRP